MTVSGKISDWHLNYKVTVSSKISDRHLNYKVTVSGKISDRHLNYKVTVCVEAVATKLCSWWELICLAFLKQTNSLDVEIQLLPSLNHCIMLRVFIQQAYRSTRQCCKSESAYSLPSRWTFWINLIRILLFQIINAFLNI